MMKISKILISSFLALSLCACATDPNAIYPDAGAISLNSFLNKPPYSPDAGPTVNVSVTYPGTNFGKYKTASGSLVPLAASNQENLIYSIQEAVNDDLDSLGFKLPQGLFANGSRTLNITISTLSFSYQGDHIIAKCVIQLQAAAGTFDHMSKSYVSTVSINNNPPADQSQVIQAVGQALNNALQKMMGDQSLINFIS